MTARQSALALAVLAAIAAPVVPVLPERSLDEIAQEVDPSAWRARFPVQYEQWRAPSRIEKQWNEKRGHAFSLKDRDESWPQSDARWAVLGEGRPKLRPLPAACLDCHASEAPSGATYWEARRSAKTPVACIRCHEAWASDISNKASGRSDPGGAGFSPPRASALQTDPARLASETCAGCHTEYYIENGRVVRPDPALLSTAGGSNSKSAIPAIPNARALEKYYDRTRRTGWTHAGGAALIEPRHPQAQMYAAGPHAANRVACPDCHMPRDARGISDHRMVDPLENIDAACTGCHRLDSAELRARVKTIQDRTEAAESRALDALVALISSIRDAAASGAPAQQLARAREFQRRAQWRIAFVEADRSKGFHAPDEAAALLLEAIDYARRGQMALPAAARRTTRPAKPAATLPSPRASPPTRMPPA